MTSFAFILGCVPLWTASGAGSIARQIMGTMVIGGTTSSKRARHIHCLGNFLSRGAMVRGGPKRFLAHSSQHGGEGEQNA
jgi:HAE1 family hydrophobic/amphiphilic exporter-1